jgi:hypothetical protein
MLVQGDYTNSRKIHLLRHRSVILTILKKAEYSNLGQFGVHTLGLDPSPRWRSLPHTTNRGSLAVTQECSQTPDHKPKDHRNRHRPHNHLEWLY